MRRIQAIFVAVVVVFLVAAAVFQIWLSVASSALVLVGQALLAFDLWGRVELDADGIILDQRVRRRRILWADVATFRVSWEGGFRTQTPHVTRRDGLEIRSNLLSELVRHRHADERRRLTAFLEARSVEHGFTLEVTEPTRTVN